MPYRDFEKTPEVFGHIVVVVGSALFAFLAGFVNLVMFEGTTLALSHMSGNINRLIESVYRHSDLAFYHFIGVLLSFVMGAMISGYFLADQHFEPRRKYGVLMILESLYLVLAVFVFESQFWLSVSLVSLAMGQQNAMASSFKGLIIRTTHLTGLFTDLGFLLGAFIKRRRFIFWRASFFINLLVGFFLGGLTGLYAYEAFKIYSLIFPAAVLLVLGFWDVYFINHNLKS